MGEKWDKKAYMKAYCEAHREQRKAYYEVHKEQINKQSKAYREAHREQANTRAKAYREAHREQANARAKAWYEAHRKPGKTHLTDAQILRTYYDNRDDTWKQLAEKLGLSEATTKTRIGFALMQECRESPTCPMKALLPEYEEKKKNG